jgi:hypothetical protein
MPPPPSLSQAPQRTQRIMIRASACYGWLLCYRRPFCSWRRSPRTWLSLVIIPKSPNMPALSPSLAEPTPSQLHRRNLASVSNAESSWAARRCKQTKCLSRAPAGSQRHVLTTRKLRSSPVSQEGCKARSPQLRQSRRGAVLVRICPPRWLNVGKERRVVISGGGTRQLPVLGWWGGFKKAAT